MIYALVSNIEDWNGGKRVVDVSTEKFDVEQSLFWVEYEGEIGNPIKFWYDTSSQEIKPMPEPEIFEEPDMFAPVNMPTNSIEAES